MKVIAHSEPQKKTAFRKYKLYDLRTEKHLSQQGQQELSFNILFT